MIRYAIRKVRESRNNNNAGSATGSNQDDNRPPALEVSPGSATPKEPIQEEPTKTGWQIWAPRLKLAGAILLPCTLETLDYTGSYLSSVACFSINFVLSGCYFSDQYCLNFQSSRFAVLYRYFLCARLDRLPPPLCIARGRLWAVCRYAGVRHCIPRRLSHQYRSYEHAHLVGRKRYFWHWRRRTPHPRSDHII